MLIGQVFQYIRPSPFEGYSPDLDEGKKKKKKKLNGNLIPKPTEKKKQDEMHKVKIVPTEKKKKDDAAKKEKKKEPEKKKKKKKEEVRVPKPNIKTRIKNPDTGEMESTYVDMGQKVYVKKGKKNVCVGTERDVLTRKHSEKYSGKAICIMEKPQAVIIHITDGIGDYNVVRNLFHTIRPNIGRPELGQANVNVGAQYVMQHVTGNEKPEIYKLVPDDRYIMRGAQGFNTYSINLEITSRGGEVTNSQIDQAVELVAYLVKKYGSIKFLMGHGEALGDGPHTALVPKAYRDLIPPQRDRINDPGKMEDGRDVMQEIRKRLKARYGIVLKN